MREHVILATKIHNPVRDEHVMEAEFNPNHRGSSRGYIRFAVDKCLQRLRTDYIDLLYLHTAPVDEEGNYTAPPEETWGAMDDLVTQGKVRYLGVSNHSSRQMGDVADALDRVGKDPSRRIVAVQNRYSLSERDRVASEEGGKEGPFLRAAEKAGAGVVPFYPLASGALTGRYRRENLDTVTGRIIDDGAADEWLTERNLNILEALAGLVQEKGITMAQLAIAWLLAQPGVASVIAGVTRMEHLEDNVKAAQVDLSEDDLKRIEGILEQEDVK